MELDDGSLWENVVIHGKYEWQPHFGKQEIKLQEISEGEEKQVRVWSWESLLKHSELKDSYKINLTWQEQSQEHGS